MDPKPPKTFSPWLVNHEGRTTVHHYTRREAVPIKIVAELADGSTRELEATAEALIYTCSETGAERRWGCQ